MSTIRRGIVSKNPKAMMWVESGFSNGHLQVVSLLSKALQKKDVDVVIVTGSAQTEFGKQIDMGNAEIVHLPELISKNGIYYSPNDKLVVNDIEWQKEREKIILKTFHQEKPDTIITEGAPLHIREGTGREFLSLFQETKNSDTPPLVYGLIRDDLLLKEACVSNKMPQDGSLRAFQSEVYKYVKKLIPEKIIGKLKKFVTDLNSGFNKTDIINELYSGGLIVRGDKNVILGKDSDFVKDIKQPIIHAGYFVADLPVRNNTDDKNREVIVSSGGGWQKEDFDLHKSAIMARKHTDLKDHIWRQVVSAKIPEKDFKKLEELSLENGNGKIIIEKSRPDLRDLIVNAAFSISQNGYNTVMEVASSGVSAVVINRQSNTEALRANVFSEKGFFETISSDVLAPEILAKSINTALHSTKEREEINFNGAENAANLIVEGIMKTWEQKATDYIPKEIPPHVKGILDGKVPETEGRGYSL